MLGLPSWEISFWSTHTFRSFRTSPAPTPEAYVTSICLSPVSPSLGLEKPTWLLTMSSKWAKAVVVLPLYIAFRVGSFFRSHVQVGYGDKTCVVDTDLGWFRISCCHVKLLCGATNPEEILLWSPRSLGTVGEFVGQYHPSATHLPL